MSLPVINTQQYQLELITSDKKLKFRPFQMRDQKIFLHAKESKNIKEILKSLVQVLQNCYLESNIDFNKLAINDIKYLFLQLRAKSVGEIELMDIRLDHKAKDKGECKSVEYEFNINSAIKYIPAKDSDIVKLNDVISIQLKSLTPEDYYSMTYDIDSTEYSMLIEVLIRSIKLIINGEEVIETKNVALDELREWIQTLSIDQMSSIQKAIDDLPKVYFDIKYTCPCGAKVHKKVTDLDDFF